MVADEVKGLSGQSRDATTQIQDQFRGVQEATEAVVGAIQTICGQIAQLSEVSTTISAAVEQQSTVTVEMRRNAGGAAMGAQEMTESVESMAQAAADTESASEQFVVASRELSLLSETLKLETDQFVTRIRGD
ncbi:MAG: methyl-accepting chemotaxis protein [Candidatus Paceibacteria bacterium]